MSRSVISKPGPSKAGKAALLAELRSRIARLDVSQAPVRPAGSVPSGAAAVDALLPGGGLLRAALHEIVADDYRDMGAAMGFLAALAARFAEASPQACVLWCEGGHAPFDVGALYGPGLAAFGLDPARLVVVSASHPVELLWTMEEALRLGALAAVVGEIDGHAHVYDLTATRRLQLAAEEGGTPALLLTGHCRSGSGVGASAAATRWRISAAPSGTGETHQTTELLGRPRWRAALDRCRGAEAGGERFVEWDARTKLLRDAPQSEVVRALSAFRQTG